MPRDDAARDAAKQDTLATLERELAALSGQGPSPAQQSDFPADRVAAGVAPASPEHLPIGHGVRPGGAVVAGPEDDALELARLDILSALFGAPTPGAL